MKLLNFSLIIILIFGTACLTVPKVKSNSEPVSHEIFNKLLQKHVSNDGKVNYEGFIKDSLTFNKYLKLLEENHPNKKNWSSEERLAYWINAYNAFTVQLIIRNYPVKSIKELGGSIYRVNTPWAKNFIQIEKETYSLDDIENGIIRKQFNEPRIHFAVNCASYSCPILRNEAYNSLKLNAQLTDQANKFINDGIRNKISADKPQISKLFKWYQGDFTKKTSLIEFINQYSKVKIKKDAEIEYLDYKWNLNK